MHRLPSPTSEPSEEHAEGPIDLSTGSDSYPPHDDDVLNEDWIIYRMVRSRRLLSLVLVAIGVGRRIQGEHEIKLSN